VAAFLYVLKGGFIWSVDMLEGITTPVHAKLEGEDVERIEGEA